MLSIAILGAACSTSSRVANPYGASTAKLGESMALLGWNMSVSNLRWESGHVLVDVDAALSGKGNAHAKPEDIRFGLYGTVAPPIEANGLGSCSGIASLAISPLSVSPLSAPNPDRLTGTVC